MTIAKMIKNPAEKLHVGTVIGIGILEAEYGTFFFARYILQHALYAFPIKYPCYHF